MKIAIEHYEETYIYESKHDSIGMTDLTEKLYGLCIAAGYHPDSVGECFFEKGREMTEHLYPDDPQEPEVNFDSAEDVVSSGVSDLVQLGACPSVVVKSRYGDERKFNVIAKNCVEYSFKDDGHTGCQLNDDGSLESVDPSGGPYIGVGTNLGDVHKELEGLTVTKIKADTDKVGTYYLTVQ